MRFDLVRLLRMNKDCCYLSCDIFLIFFWVIEYFRWIFESCLNYELIQNKFEFKLKFEFESILLQSIIEKVLLSSLNTKVKIFAPIKFSKF